MENKIDVKNIPVDVQIQKPEQQPHYNPRSHIYVRAVKGLHQQIRQRMGFVFLGLFMLLPWLQFNGHQAILFDIVEQKFNIFGLTLFPQDLTLLAWIFIIAAFGLFFVTTFYGRVWCGYLCPQTVWTFIFIWFEEKIEGNHNQRKKLDERPMDADKFWRKSLKHFAWWAFATLTALVFVGYFTPIDKLFIDFFTFNASFWATVSVVFFAFCTYGNAGWMREIMCLHICPYARFQSAMFDKDTFTVTYDAKRGESRGPRSRKQDPKALGLGDCIDCNLCVQVCPTGIDIRNGLQYECINCGACIDACDGVMDKMGYEKGLIAYTTEHSLSGKLTKVMRPKLIGYFIVMCVMVGTFGWNLASRSDMELDVIRDRGSLFRETNEGLIENVYTLKIVNKSQQDQTYSLSLNGLVDYQWDGERTITIRAGEVASVPLSIAADTYNMETAIQAIEFVITKQADQSQLSEPSKFFTGRK